MIFGQDRQELRRMYAAAWQKSRSGEVLSPLEAQISRVIEDHPEYIDTISGEQLDADYTPERGEANPFLHMGLHLAIREQVATDRPPGIRALFESLAARLTDAHVAEHRMLDCLAETLWEAQQRQVEPDEQAYLERLRRL